MKIGLTLSRGGGRGAYQIGVWKALIELGIDKNIKWISGSSVGAVNAVLMSNGEYAKVYSMWEGLESSGYSPNSSGFNLNEQSLRALIKKEFYKFSLKIPTLICCVDLSSVQDNADFVEIAFKNLCEQRPHGLPIYYQLEHEFCKESEEVLIASCSIPDIFPPLAFKELLLMDGGLIDPLPTFPLLEKKMDLIIEVLPYSESQILAGVKTGLFKKYSRTLRIQPISDLGSSNDFSRKTIRQRIKVGYQDAIKILKAKFI